VFSRIDHIGVAVEQIEPALALYRDSFELGVAHREVVREQGVEAVLLDVGENHVELLAPLHPDTPVGKFLARQGPGLHHVAYQVGDIDATLKALKQAGLQLIDEQPRAGIRGSRVAFVHPRATAGVLTEIVQPASGHEPPAGHEPAAGHEPPAGHEPAAGHSAGAGAAGAKRGGAR
jgi:methylmalonyl-CoA/ethylmalonyl-CoA epimerase